MSKAELDRLLLARTPSAIGTRVIVLACLAIYGAMALAAGSVAAFSGPLVVSWGAQSGPLTTNGEWWRLLSATFLHAHLVHLLGNMLCLLIVAPAVERLLGPPAFVPLYLLCGLIGSVVSLVANPYGTAVGASGAIMGVYGMLLALMLRLPRGMSDSPGEDVAAIATLLPRVHMRPVVGGIVLTLVQGWWVPHVDNAAHAGGLVAGVAAGWLVARDVERQPVPAGRVAALVVAGLLSSAALAGTVEPTADLRTVVLDVFTLESRSSGEYTRAVDAREAPAVLATLIEGRILPAVAAQRRTLAATGRVPPPYASAMTDLDRLLALRQEAWQLRLQGHREGDAARMARAAAVDEQADLVVRRILQIR